MDDGRIFPTLKIHATTLTDCLFISISSSKSNLSFMFGTKLYSEVLKRHPWLWALSFLVGTACPELLQAGCHTDKWNWFSSKQFSSLFKWWGGAYLVLVRHRAPVQLRCYRSSLVLKTFFLHIWAGVEIITWDSIIYKDLLQNQISIAKCPYYNGLIILLCLCNLLPICPTLLLILVMSLRHGLMFCSGNSHKMMLSNSILYHEILDTLVE